MPCETLDYNRSINLKFYGIVGVNGFFCCFQIMFLNFQKISTSPCSSLPQEDFKRTFLAFFKKPEKEGKVQSWFAQISIFGIAIANSFITVTLTTSHAQRIIELPTVCMINFAKRGFKLSPVIM